MKAAQISQYGDPSVIQIVEIDPPQAGPGQVLIEVYSSSLNPFDTTIRAGYMKDIIPLSLPVTLGGDIAGVITNIGEGVTGFKTGDKVYGQANVVAGNSGAFAGFATTTAEQVAIIPQGLDFDQAASLPLVGISALQALTSHIGLAAGQSIFINGGAGAIGAIAIQLAKHLGAQVATTATGDGLELVKQLGADEVIDYKTADYATMLSGYDAVFDTAGNDFNKTFSILKPGGVAVSMAAQADGAKASELGVTALTQSTAVTTEALNQLTALVESGVITPRVQQTFSLTEIVAAFQAREAGGVNGKIVIKHR